MALADDAIRNARCNLGALADRPSSPLSEPVLPGADESDKVVEVDIARCRHCVVERSMTRVQDKPAAPQSTRTAADRARLPHDPAAYELHGDPAKVLAALALKPREARVLVIPSSVRAKERLRKSDVGHLVSAAQLAAATPSRQARATVIDKSAFEPDARSRALLQGVWIAQQDLREAGGAYDLDQVRALMHGISRQRVDRRVKERTLLAVPGPSNRRLYPTIQFNRDGSVVDGLKPMLEALPTRNPWVALNFLARPDHRLDGRKPIDLLRQGEVDIVVEAASRMAEQGG
jgi:hypothetical protein